MSVDMCGKDRNTHQIKGFVDLFALFTRFGSLELSG